MTALPFFKFIHLLSVLVWVGGMFFAYMILRPAAVDTLEPPLRLRLWNTVFQRFFNWVWTAVGILLISGFFMIYLYGGIAQVGWYVHAMLALGVVMMLIYGYVFFACYVPLSLHVNKQRWKEAGEMLAKIRQWVAINLTLGMIIMLIVFVGR